MQDLKEWTRVFKGLANLSRLRIIGVLTKEKELSVSELAQQIHVTVRGTSKHLSILHHVGVVDRDGRAGQVFYSLNPAMRGEIRSILSKFLS